MKLMVIYLVCYVSYVRARCRFRGECAVIGSHAKPCPVDMEAVSHVQGLHGEEAEQAIGILANRCPHMVYDDEGNIKPYEEILTCCEPIQVMKLSSDLALGEGVLGRCPTCFRNFVRQICEMYCSPDQSRFVEVHTEIGPNNIEYVEAVDYRLHEPFMLTAFESCSDVIVPQTGLPAVNMMCGSAVVCDADAWFKFTGDTAGNPMAPLQINFQRWPTEEDSMNVVALPCTETMEGDLPCSCVDCSAMCPVGSKPIVPEICKIFNVNCLGFAIGLTVFVISVTIFIVLTLLEYRRKRSNTSRSSEIREIDCFTKFFQKCFSRIGVFSAGNPVLMIMIASWVTFSMLYGVFNINLTTNPIELWSSPDSRSRQELNYFNTRFGPFYRAAQVFLHFKGLDSFSVDNVTYGPAFRIEALRELVHLENKIKNIGREQRGVTLEEVCYAPIRSRGAKKELDQCVYLSASVYLGENRNDIDENTYLDDIQSCLNNFFSFDCLANWGGGAEPEAVFGGFEGDDVLSANTLIINFPITNFNLEENLRPVLEWEEKFIELMQNYEASGKSDYVEVAFGAERSIEDEIRRVSVAEAVPIAISYLIMFIYVTLALGNIRYCKTWLIDSKILVAIGSIVVVVISIICAMGVMGYANFTTTLLAINVIPFFILSVGIDNVFLMINTLHDIQKNVKEYEDYDESFSFEKKKRFIFEKMMGSVGPSMFVSSVTQITCFAIGSITDVPAVATFSVFASLSLTFLFIFQITAVVGILSLDYKRVAQKRVDIFPCIRSKISMDSDHDPPHVSIMNRFMILYSDIITNWKVRIVVVIFFMIVLSLSIIAVPHLEVGLDQEMALPTDSYVYRYLVAVSELLRLGPPVYFVLKAGLDFTNPDHQNVICGTQLCYEDSLITQIFLAAQHSEITYIARSSNSWLDDFFDWSSLPGTCCKYNVTDNGFCQTLDTSPECAYCSISRNEWSNGLRPSKEAFETFLPFFLQDEPSQVCTKGGLASYSSSVNYLLDSEGRAIVHDTNFMAYQTALSRSPDFINAVKYGYEISDNITATIRKHTGMDVEVFPYSVFYVFFEQYLNIWSDTFAALGFSVLGALAINLLASGFNFLTSFAVILTAVMVVIDMMGVMYIWNIPLNPVSCINLIVSIGISVEFCSHIAYAYATSRRPDHERVKDAIQKVGSTVITGITFTNIPIVVLAFSHTEVIEVFFFRMFFSLIILGFLHGLVFFPALLLFLNNIKTRSF